MADKEEAKSATSHIAIQMEMTKQEAISLNNLFIHELRSQTCEA